jgi:hypothetical protein
VKVQGEFTSTGGGTLSGGKIAPSTTLAELRAEGWAVISTINIDGDTATLLLQRPKATV